LKKILIIRFSSIGDIVLTSPVLRCIKNQYPDAKLHFVTKVQYKGLLEYNPYIDKIHTLERNISKLIQQLWAENFDFIIDLHNNIRSHRICIALLKRVGRVYKLNFAKWIIVNTKTDLLPTLHVVDRYIEAASHINLKNDNKGLDFFLPPSMNLNQLNIPSVFKENNYIAWVLGGKHNTKIFPAEKIINICSKLNFPIILLGDSNDQTNGELIAQAASIVYNFAGKLSLFESAMVVKNASVVVTNDTGLMHIAAAFQKKIVSLWGSTVKAFGMYPYMPQAKFDYRIIEVANLSCRPCSKIGFKVCPKKHFKCMNEINENEVLEAILNFAK